MRLLVQKGFSLLELLVVMALIGIIIAIAYPTYSHHLVTAKRRQAIFALHNLANQMEAYHSVYQSYDAIPLALLNLTKRAKSLSYTLKITKRTPNHFVIAAIPVGTQAKRDLACGTLQLNDQGQYTITGTQSATQCWR